MNKKRCYQQGDVLLFEIEGIPTDAKKVPQEEHQNILRRGEATGHAHRVNGFMEMYRQATRGGENIFMGIPKRITLTHEEHDTHEVPPGMYFVGGVREFNHIANESRRIMD